MKARIVAGAALFGLGAVAVAHGVLTDARVGRLRDLLVEIETAAERVPHSGTRAIEWPGWRVVQRVESGEGRRRLEIVELSAEGKTFRRPPFERRPYLNGLPDILRPGHGQWSRRIKDYGLALRNYDFEVSEGRVVAGRQADVLEIRPRRPGRPAYRVAADASNRFPLAFEVLSGDRRVFSLEYRRIEYCASVPAGSATSPSWPSWLRVERREAPVGALSNLLGCPVWAPARPPWGFELRRSSVVGVRVEIPEEIRSRLPFPVPRLDARVAHLDYTDGIAVLSVVECPAGSELWRLARRFLPAEAAGAGPGKVVARRFVDHAGAACLMEIDKTVVLAAGNVAAGEIEEMLRTFERR